MKTIIAIICLMAAMGCGREVKITYHTNVPVPVVAMIAGKPAAGVAVINTKPNLKGITHSDLIIEFCDIYLIPRPEDVSDACWAGIITHEQRHCYEGDWHPKDTTGLVFVCGELQ